MRLRLAGISLFGLVPFCMLIAAASLPAQNSAAGFPREPIKAIIDTDIGEDIDDILVTAFALNSPEFEVLAVTTVDGNVAARSRVAAVGSMIMESRIP